MRTSDPAAYDNFIELTTATKLVAPFRALYFTHSSASTWSCVIGKNVNGEIVNKTIVVNTVANSPFILPLSGNEVTVTFAAGKCYAFI